MFHACRPLVKGSSTNLLRKSPDRETGRHLGGRLRTADRR